MREIGGYIELDTYIGKMLYENGILLNSGRNCLLYLAEKKNISRIKLPYFLCDSVYNTCKKAGIEVEFYHIGMDFLIIDPLKLQDDEWLYVVDYYNQLSDEYLDGLKKKYKRIILDCTQSYFRPPVEEIDTIYTCRKFFGVADGAVLFSDVEKDDELETDQSYSRMEFLHGRFERTASEFYKGYVDNNRLFADMPVKKMSKLTYNLLHGVDYEYIKETRSRNFNFLKNLLDKYNAIKLKESEGAFAYPFYLENGQELRKFLISNKIYIPMLWPNVVNDMPQDSNEYRLANNILPLPCDQRYNEDDMKYMADMILQWRKEND